MEPGNGDSIVLEEEIDQNYVPSEVTRVGNIMLQRGYYASFLDDFSCSVRTLERFRCAIFILYCRIIQRYFDKHDMLPVCRKRYASTRNG